MKYVLLQDGEPFDLIEVRITYMKFVLNLSKNKMKTKKIAHCQNSSNGKIVEREKINTNNIQIHDCLLYWLDTGTSKND